MENPFKLKKACNECPFRKEGGVTLSEGRLAGIAKDLMENDHNTFQCHKTVHSKVGGEWDDEGEYHASGKESMCFGAMVYLHKQRRPTVMMRIGLISNMYSLNDIEADKANIVDDVKEAKVFRKKYG